MPGHVLLDLCDRAPQLALQQRLVAVLAGGERLLRGPSAGALPPLAHLLADVAHLPPELLQLGALHAREYTRVLADRPGPLPNSWYFCGRELERTRANLVSDAEKWRRFELLLTNFQAVGRSQSFYVNALATSVLVVWAVDLLHHSGGITVQLLGASIQINGLWKIAPLVCGILCLALIGSINFIHHAWRRLDLQIQEVFPETPSFFFTEFDPHKNILDYLAVLTLSLRKPVLPDTADNPAAENLRWEPSLLLYPTLVMASIFTTAFTLRRVDVTWWSVAYVWTSTLLQSLFAFPFLWRKACLFTGVHKNAYEGIEWGPEAYYNMPLASLERLVRKAKQREEGHGKS